MFDVVRNNAIRESLNIESLLLQSKRFGEVDGLAMQAEYLKNVLTNSLEKAVHVSKKKEVDRTAKNLLDCHKDLCFKPFGTFLKQNTFYVGELSNVAA